MNYRKYKYLRLDGSSTIMDRRDMVRDFQHRYDITFSSLSFFVYFMRLTVHKCKPYMVAGAISLYSC